MGKNLREFLKENNIPEKLINDVIESGYDCGRQGNSSSGESWEVIIDKMAGIAHNKVIVIDKRKVITGSFNFTKAADYRNAENLLLIENKKIAEIYLKNWQKRAMANEKRS
jgi:phosphatidylserine/phosphatidylglycerophosphate/cardiolipin synthase-like enzyme